MVLENVAKKSTADILSQQLHRLGYMCQCIMANSCSFGVPQSRTRLYLMGIDPLQAEVTQPPERWVQLLQDTSQVIFDAVMLFFFKPMAHASMQTAF